MRSAHERNFELLALAHGLAIAEKEYKFHPTRKWRFDFAWPEQKVAVEIEGGVYSGGRHNRPLGYIGDCEKYNAAVLEGWRVLRLTPNMITFEWVLIIKGILNEN